MLRLYLVSITVLFLSPLKTYGSLVDLPFLSCDAALSRLTEASRIQKYLDIHRGRVLSNAAFAGDIVPVDKLFDGRREHYLELEARRNSTEALEWLKSYSNRATAFHGSSSESLMAFLQKGSLGLLPNRVLIGDLGIVPQTGRFDSLGDGTNELALNMLGMNVVSLLESYEALTYAYLNRFYFPPADWARIRRESESHSNISFLDYREKLFARRIHAREQIPEKINWLFSEPFPVVYGFQLNPEALTLRIGVHNIVASNLSPEELRLVLVPEENIKKVEDIFSSSFPTYAIKVASLDAFEMHLKETPRADGDHFHQFEFETYPLSEEEFSSYMRLRWGRLQ